MASVLALDFDGVICDSVDESLISACNAWNTMQGSTVRVATLADVESHVAQRFRQYRHLARNAPDFWLLLHWTLTGNAVLSEAELDSFRLEYAATIRRFEPRFFAARDELRSRDPGKWLALHRNYPAFQDGWDQLKGTLPTHIITTKDLKSIEFFNREWNLGLPAKNLWTNERRMSKGAIARKIIAGAGIQPDELFFVDDHPHHLQDVAEVGARCFWASWGYLGAAGLSLPKTSAAIPLARMADLRNYLPPA